MTSSSYTSEPFLLRALRDAWPPKMFRNMPLGDWLVARIAQHEALATMLGTSEALATRWLAAKPDLKTMKRDDYKGECIDRFGISGRDYQFRVWPAARKLAGLTKARKARSKEANQKIIVTPIRDIHSLRRSRVSRIQLSLCRRAFLNFSRDGSE